MELKLEFITGQDKDGEDITEMKTFTTRKIMSRLVVDAFELSDEITTKDFTTESLHKLADFTCKAYGDRFTRDQLYDGLESDQLLLTVKGTMEGVINGVKKRQDTFPGNK